MVRLHALVPIDLPGNPRKAKFQRRLEVGFEDVFPWTVVIGLHGRWAVISHQSSVFADSGCSPVGQRVPPAGGGDSRKAEIGKAES